MKQKVLKVLTVLLLTTILFPNFSFLGIGIKSYAIESIAQKKEKVSFNVAINGSVMEMGIEVNKGYLDNCEITIRNSNFKIENNPEYGEKIRIIEEKENNNTKIIFLNRIDANKTFKFNIDYKKPEEGIINKELLNSQVEFALKGTYSGEKERINGEPVTNNKTVEVAYPKEIRKVENKELISLVTNNDYNLVGKQQKDRVIQFKINLGNESDNYPMESDIVNVKLENIEADPTKITLRSSNYNYNHISGEYDGKTKTLKITAQNIENENKQIRWDKENNDEIMVTLVYGLYTSAQDKIDFKNLNISAEEKIKFVGEKDAKQGKTYNKNLGIEIANSEAFAELKTELDEKEIYNGPISSKQGKEITSKTNLMINLNETIQDGITIKEEQPKYIGDNGKIEVPADMDFIETRVSKKQIEEINTKFDVKITAGEKEIMLNDQISLDQNKDIKIENSNIVITYPENTKNIGILISRKKDVTNEEKLIDLKIGNDLEFIHKMKIKENQDIRNYDKIQLSSKLKYNEIEKNPIKTEIGLKDSQLNFNIIENKENKLVEGEETTVNTKIIFNRAKENEELLNNTNVNIIFPVEVEEVTIENFEFIGDVNVKIGKTKVETEGNVKKAIIQLEGKQNEYTQNNETNLNCTFKVKTKRDINLSNENSKIELNVQNNGKETKKEIGIKVYTNKGITISQKATIDGTEVNKIEDNMKENQVETTISVKNNNSRPITIKEIQLPIKTNLNLEINNKAMIGKEEFEISNNIIKLQKDIEASKECEIKYTYKLPQDIEHGKQITQGIIVKYTDEQISQEIIEQTGKEIILKTEEIKPGETINPIKLELNAKVGLEEAKIVSNGEVIKYQIKVSNQGNQPIGPIEVKAQVPNGTYFVKPCKDYAYTGPKYYDKVENPNTTIKIDEMLAGDTKVFEYEVKVEENLKAGSDIVNKVEILGKGIKAEPKENILKSKNSNIILTAKRVTPEEYEINEGGKIEYYVTIENNTDKSQETEVMVQTQDEMNASKVKLISGYSGYDTNINFGMVESTDINKPYDKINVKLNPKEIKVLEYTMKINDNTKDMNNVIQFLAIATSGKDTYRSNVYNQKVRDIDFDVKMTSMPSERKELKLGDRIEYTISIVNNKKDPIVGLRIYDEVPEELIVNEVFLGQEKVKMDFGNLIDIQTNLEAEQDIDIKIVAEVGTDIISDKKAIPIVNYAKVNVPSADEKDKVTNSIEHIILNEAYEENPENPSNPDNPNNPNNPNGPEEMEKPDYIAPDIAQGINVISGHAWIDKNSNGIREDSEKTLSGIKAKIYNPATGNLIKDKTGKILETVTDENGIYIFEEVPYGEYIVIFEYDEQKYKISPYRVKESKNDNNSDAIINTLMINGQKTKVASTDIIKVNKNISNMDIGLIEVKKIDFKLDKYISRILIQNASGTTVKEFNNSTLAKIELRAEKIKGSTVIIEYKLKVTNLGETEGYIRKISDHMPSTLKFNSELNKDWYQSGEKLYNNTMANTKIKPGESKEIKLTLTKLLSDETEIGRIGNTAKIEEFYSPNGVGEDEQNNTGAADMILSIYTGGIVFTTTIATTVVLLAIIVIMINKKVFKNKKEDI